MTVAIEMTAIVIVLASGQFIARPLIFFFPLLMLWMGGLISARERNAPPPWWLIPILTLWANVHASFTIAFVLAAIIGMEALAAAPSSERRRTAIRWASFGVLALASTGATPYGFEPLLITFKLFGGNEAVQYISEWRPIGISMLGMFAVSALAVSVALLSTAPLRNMFRILLVLVCGFLMMRHMRFAGLFAITAAFTLAGPLTHQFAGLRPQKAQFGRRLRIASSAALVALIGVSTAMIVSLRPSPNASIVPSTAFETARNLGAVGPVFNDYDFGGYLISQGVKTFIDGRTDQLFIDGFFSSLREAEASGDELKIASLLQRHKVTWALLRANSSASAKLEKLENWEKVYQDDVATVFLKRNSTGELPDRS
jgi:hypothetical protein